MAIQKISMFLSLISRSLAFAACSMSMPITVHIFTCISSSRNSGDELEYPHGQLGTSHEQFYVSLKQPGVGDSTSTVFRWDYMLITSAELSPRAPNHEQ